MEEPKKEWKFNQMYFITRGNTFDVHRFITHLQGKTLPLEWDGKYLPVELSVRPIQLWEIAYPREHQELMCRTLFTEESAGAAAYPKEHMKLMQSLLRLPLKCRKIPKWNADKTLPVLPLHKENISILGIGMREDKESVEYKNVQYGK